MITRVMPMCSSIGQTSYQNRNMSFGISAKSGLVRGKGVGADRFAGRIARKGTDTAPPATPQPAPQPTGPSPTESEATWNNPGQGAEK